MKPPTKPIKKISKKKKKKDFKELVKPQNQNKLPTLEFQPPSGSTLMALLCLMPASVNDRLL